MRWVQLFGSLNILWHCLSLGLEWKLTFSSPVATAEFSIYAATDQLFHSQPSMFLLWPRQLPQCGDQTPASVPPPPRAGPVLLTLLCFPLVPSSYPVLRGSIYSFPLVRYSCPFSAGILRAFLCLKVYSWCIHGERCILCPPTSLPSCSLIMSF